MQHNDAFYQVIKQLQQLVHYGLDRCCGERTLLS